MHVYISCFQTSYNVSKGEIYYVIATWHQQKGVLLYFNHVLVATETEGTTISQGNPLVERNPNFNIGRNVRGEAYAPISISSFTTFNTFIDNENIMNVFMFFVTSGMVTFTFIFDKKSRKFELTQYFYSILFYFRNG